MRQKAWVKWRKRALAAERQLGSTQRMFYDATGMDTTTWLMMTMAKVSAASPREGVIITGIQTPTTRLFEQSPTARKVFVSSSMRGQTRTASAKNKNLAAS